jgi:hypothetical protein
MNSLAVVTLLVLQITGAFLAGLPDCGVDISKRPTTAHVSGSNTTSIQNPWTVAILLEKNALHCTGSLLTRRHILSAAHCFFQKKNLNRYRIAFGVHDLTTLDFQYIPSIIRTIKDVKFPPNYQFPRAYSDVALIVVKKRVDFSDTIHPVCLPDYESYEENPFYKNSVTIVGFGSEPGDNQKNMRQHNQEIRAFNFCNERYSVSYAGPEHKSLLKRIFPTGFDRTLTCASNSR